MNDLPPDTWTLQHTCMIKLFNSLAFQNPITKKGLQPPNYPRLDSQSLLGTFAMHGPTRNSCLDSFSFAEIYCHIA